VYTWPWNTETERSTMCHMDDVIDTVLSTFDIISSAVMIKGGVVDWDHVITRTILGMLF
jgi:hypothetical protein